MPSSDPIAALNTHIREAFYEAWLAIFEGALGRREGHECLPAFAAHYRRLTALPRRTRRSMERKWKRTLSAIALLMTLGQAPAWAAIIEVTPGTPPSINADGKCSLIEAIVNANRDRRTHLDCVAGAGADTIVCPRRAPAAQRRRRSCRRSPRESSSKVTEALSTAIPLASYLNFLTRCQPATSRSTKPPWGATGRLTNGYGVSNAGRLVP